MAAPISLKNTQNQSLDVLADEDGTIRLKLGVGAKSGGGLTADRAWQGVATHVDADPFVASDGMVVIAGVDRTGTDTARPIIVDPSGRPYAVLTPSTGSTANPGTNVITVGATSQTLFAVNTSRKYLLVQNLDASEDLWIDFTADAVRDKPSIKIVAGGAFVMEASYVTSEKVTIIATTINHKFSAKEA